MTFKFNRRFLGLGVSAVCVYFFATNSQVVWLYVISSFLVGAIPVGLIAPLVLMHREKLGYKQMSRKGFSPPLPQDHKKVFVGDEVNLMFETRDLSTRVSLFELLLGDGTRIKLKEEERKGEIRTVSFRAPKRGMLDIREVVLRCDWPLGIIRTQKNIPCKQNVLVYPIYWIPNMGGQTGSNEGMNEAFKRGHGSEFLGLRDYLPGDTSREVHWKTSARMGKLMVVETAIESENFEKFELSLNSSASEEIAETAVSIAASLVAGCVSIGRDFRFMILGEGKSSQGWENVMSHLANSETGDQAAGSIGKGITRIIAEADSVKVITSDKQQQFDSKSSISEIKKNLKLGN